MIDKFIIFAIIKYSKSNKKGVMNLSGQEELMKAIKGKMKKLSKQLDRSEFFSLFENELKILQQSLPLALIFEWLERIDKKEIPIAWGVIGVYKTKIGDWQTAKRCFLEVNRKIPNKIWEELIEKTLTHLIMEYPNPDNGKGFRT